MKQKGEDALTLEEVREKLGTQFERINTNKEEQAQKEEDVAFAAFRHKNRYGHKNEDGLEANKSEFSGNYYYCNGKGHVAWECRKLKKDMTKKAKADMEKNEKASLAIGERYPGYNEGLGF